MNRRAALVLSAALAAPSLAVLLPVAEVSTTLSMSFEVLAACAVAADSLTFPATAAGGTGPTATSTITVTCASGTNYNVTLDAGTNVFNLERRMCVPLSATDCVTYELYQDAARTMAWGDGGFANTYPSAIAKAGTGTGADQVLTVYGAVGALTGSTPGAYEDSVLVTVHF